MITWVIFHIFYLCVHLRGIYDNVSQFRKKDLNNGVLKSDGITSNNNSDALSISSGGDNSTSSASQSPSGYVKYI
jgi:hypothetical protein